MNEVNERFPNSMHIVGLEPGFTIDEWKLVMSVARSPNIRAMAYQEWLNEQDEKYDFGNWRWYLSYLHSTAVVPVQVPIERSNSPVSPIGLVCGERMRELYDRPPTPPSS